MHRIILLLVSFVLLASCAEQYNIAGNSSVSCLDGRMLYLCVSVKEDAHDLPQSTVRLDSCKVEHGRFNFEGSMDSVMMAMIYTGNQCVMPLVIESANLNIQVDNATQRVSGGPLNDRLYSFFKKRNRLDNELWELQQRTIRMMREGHSPAQIQRKVGKRIADINRRTEELETRFVMDNYDNVLGPGFFRLLCSQYPSPIMTTQIQKIVKEAPQHFLHDPFVNYYVTQARSRILLCPPDNGDMPAIQASQDE